MREGARSVRLGLRGMPAATESIAVGRDVEMASLTGARFHVAHLSSKESLDHVRAAKAHEIIEKVEPRMVIPMHYKIPGLKQELDPLDIFLKEVGKTAETLDTLKVEKSGLPEEDIKFVVLKANT